MILKWIRVSVPDGSRDAFSKAQEQWIALREASGFLGQLGGWSERTKGEACILAWWKDETSYRAFMTHEHDVIVGRSRQDLTYESIDVLLLWERLRMPGQFASPTDAVADAGFLRVADCLLKPERVEPFAVAQKEIWIKGMAPVEGMLGGSYSEVLSMSRHILVFSLWSSAETHREYELNVMPELRKAAKVSDDLSYLTGVFVKLEPTWSVSPL